MPLTEILVAGGAGYIGSQCCKELQAAGFKPVVLDNLSTGYRENVRWGELYEGDIADAAFLDKVFAAHAFAGVMHFAAHSVVGESMREPGKYYRNNVGGSLTLLNAMTRHNVRPIVFSSTAATYGEPLRTPIDEDHPQAPINAYGRSKLMVEGMLKDFDTAHGLRYASLRYFNAAGADPEGQTGEAHDPESHLIPLAIAAAEGKRGALQIYGDDYDTPDGTCVRDYIHTVDLASAHILALKWMLDGGESAAYNLGNGAGFSVLDVLKTVGRLCGKDVPAERAGRREGDPARLVGASDKIRKALGWTPQYPRLEDIVGHALAWTRSAS